MNPRTIRLVGSTLLTRETAAFNKKNEYLFNNLSAILKSALERYGYSDGKTLDPDEIKDLTEVINRVGKQLFQNTSAINKTLEVGVPLIELPINVENITFKWDGIVTENDSNKFEIICTTEQILWLDTIGDKLLISNSKKTKDGFLKTSLVSLTENLSIANLKL